MSRLGSFRDRALRRIVGFDPGVVRRSDERLARLDRRSLRQQRRLGRVLEGLAGTNTRLDEVAHIQTRVADHLAELSIVLEQVSKEVAGTQAELAYLRARARAQAAVIRSERHDVDALRARLEEVRATPEYAAVWDEEEPLVSVRIPTWNRPQQIVEVAIASVLAQTYQNFEIIVVSDGPSETNRAAVEGVGDPRIRYFETDRRNEPPAEPRNRYLIAGASGMNVGVRLARGTWIAPLDDDDEFTPDHIEKLLALARTERAELVYGALTQRIEVTGTEALVWGERPAFGRFSFQGALYLRALSFMEYDEQSWLYDEPGDWDLVDRMLQAGVRFATTPDVVGTLHTVPYTHK